MGQEECRCLRQTKSEAATEESISNRQLQEKIHSARFRINTISKPSSAQRAAAQSQQRSRTRRNVSLVFKGIKPEFIVKFDLVEPDVLQKVFVVGSEQDTPLQGRVKKFYQDDRFRCSVKYSANNFGGGSFYIKDDAVGLGCFYRLRSDSQLELKNNMIVSIGSEFMVSSMTVSSALTNSQVSQISQVARGTNMAINFHGGNIPQGQTVGINLLNKQKIRVGRSPQCDVPINDPLLSPIHCTVSKEDNHWMLADGNEQEHSATGTWVYLSHTTPIYNGMELRCGSTLFTVEIRR